MESSEEDAGAAAGASRRASARERDVGGGSRDGGGGVGPEPSASSSEEAFDADSVPSPSPSQELNTSTEAILDMIDEIVEGPDALRRRSHTSIEREPGSANSSSADTAPCDPGPHSAATPPPPTLTNSDPSETQPQGTVSHIPPESLPHCVAASSEISLEKVPPDIVNNEIKECNLDAPTGDVTTSEKSQGNSIQDSPSESSISVVEVIARPEEAESLQVECSVPTQVLPLDVNTDSVSTESQNRQDESRLPSEVQSDNVNTIGTLQESVKVEHSQSCSEVTRQTGSPQASSSVVSNEVAQSTSAELPSQLQLELACSLSPSTPSSSVTETVPIKLDSSENQASERTIKCVTSSDNRDNVTVESAESTCSESDGSGSARGARVSEGGMGAVRSPLRRRLVRPAPSDRRPDSTVSSSGDSHTDNVHTTEQTTSESVTKDVSSSSDAVSTVYFNKKPEEIRDVSEISVCKAETSMSPPKKIKLVRQRTAPSTSQRDVIPVTPICRENEQCQSTSSECIPSAPAQRDTLPESVTQSADADPGCSSDSLADNCTANLPIATPESEREIPACSISRQASLCTMETPALAESQQTSEDYDQRKVPPIKLNLCAATETSSIKTESQLPIVETAGPSKSECRDSLEPFKQVPKLTIKLGSKQSEEPKSPIPKLTIKPIKPTLDTGVSKKEPVSEQIPSITKLNIKPIPKPAEMINDVHRKSSSSEISESESSENDESNSMSDQTSNSDHGLEVVPKVTIKVGKRGTDSEGKFYTEQNAPKLLIKNVQSQDNENFEEKQLEKIPKLTIKNVSKADGQPLSPKLTRKPIKQPETLSESTPTTSQIPKLRVSTEAFVISTDAVQENTHVPKITIKPVLKTDIESTSKTKKSTVVCDSPDHIPVITKLNIKPVLKPDCNESPENIEEKIPIVSKLNIKPILKPMDSSDDVSEDSESQIPVVSRLNIKPVLRPPESGEENQDIPVISKLNIKPILKPVESEDVSEGIKEKVPVVSKLNIKPVLKPKDCEGDCNMEDIPKVTKLNIKPLRHPEAGSSEEKDCNVLNADEDANSIPVVTKINIKPIIKPMDSENQSSETGNSSDDNADHIPVVTRLNIKPILKPIEVGESAKTNSSNLDNIPVVTKLNIKPLVKPEENKSPSSPKKECLKITKLNIKPVVKPEELGTQDICSKNPPLLMKINMKEVTSSEMSDHKKVNNIGEKKEHLANNVEENVPKVSKLNIKPVVDPDRILADTSKPLVNCKQSSSQQSQPDVSTSNCVPEVKEKSLIHRPVESHNEKSKVEVSLVHTEQNPSSTLGEINRSNENVKFEDTMKVVLNQIPNRTPSSLQNCTLLKKLLESKKDGLDKRLEDSKVNSNHSLPVRPEKDMTGLKETVKSQELEISKIQKHLNETHFPEAQAKHRELTDISCSEREISVNLSNLTKPLEISISDKLTNQSSGQDSPRIILKINKTDHGPSAKIITEERPATPQQNDVSMNTQEVVNDKQTPKRIMNSRKKPQLDTAAISVGKRLRSSRIVEEKTSPVKRNIGKRPSSTETSPVQSKEPELSVLESKRLKLGQLLSSKALVSPPALAPRSGPTPPAPAKDSPPSPGTRQVAKTVNHTLLNNENCSKNGNSKLHNILSNLQAKQAQALALTERGCAAPELESNASSGSSDVVEVLVPVNSHADASEVISINDTSESRSLPAAPEDAAPDPLTVEAVAAPASESAPPPEPSATPEPTPTPTPKRRGRPRKVPTAATPATPQPPTPLPVPALEERPQRSLRLSRERPTPTILAKPRGRGRGRGARRVDPATPREEPVVETASKFFEEVLAGPEEDPTSSRIKLPRMTEALDKLPSTPLSSRRRSSASCDIKAFEAEPKVVLSLLPEDALRSPETPRGRGRGRGARGKTPRSPRAYRGRGRGGGRGAQYMKETMGIYGRVCGPATTTVQLFEEETCMMDDNATPAKPLNYDEDSQSSVLSSTNDSNKMKRSKFADLFDSNKVWTAADVKEYMWPPPETPGVEHQVMMIQEQVAMFLGVKSFKRRYPELKRRAVTGDERLYVLSKQLVTEALCDLGITAVDASEVLDIMLSDYPHKYEEYRTHQRQRQLAEASAKEAAAAEDSQPEKVDRVEMKPEVKPVETKPEVPKVDLEKARQEAMAAAIASATEWNARLNAARRPAYVDLQSHTVHRRRAPVTRAPAPVVCPPGGFYPHSLLPGQYQHHYRTYTSEQLRYFPLNTVVAAPAPLPSPAPSESDTDASDSSSSSDDSVTDRPRAKRKKLTKTKRGSQAEGSSKEEVKEEVVDLCRVCKLRLEANRKSTHERFLVCSKCDAKLHPGCVDLSADTIRKAREYAWQCAACKACCGCLAPADGPLLFCDLCDRGFHIHCVGLDKMPAGRWHCVECAICKSCGAREPSGPPGLGAPGTPGTPGTLGTPGEEATWHHQTKRGPGGHKVYSHSLCTPCARAYRIGRYCPLCERSFIGPKGTMQLVICKLCDRQHHQECVRQTVSALNVLDYTCSECRRGGITSRSAAARLAPRTIATLFMAKRRFNKYAHRQYMQSRQAAKAQEPAEETSMDTDVGEEASCEPPEPVLAQPLDASDASDCGGDAADASDPLEGAGDAPAPDADAAEPPDEADAAEPPDEAAAAVAALRMDFGD